MISKGDTSLCRCDRLRRATTRTLAQANLSLSIVMPEDRHLNAPARTPAVVFHPDLSLFPPPSQAGPRTRSGPSRLRVSLDFDFLGSFGIRGNVEHPEFQTCSTGVVVVESMNRTSSWNLVGLCRDRVGPRAACLPRVPRLGAAASQSRSDKNLGKRGCTLRHCGHRKRR